MAESDDLKTAICQFLAGASVADHLGDIRDDESYLWKALGVTREEVSAEWFDTESPATVARNLARRHSLPFPDSFLEDDDE
jgi:hypothetical protein